MSQHDYVIDNAGGAAVRADINNALQAIKTLNSGATAPTVTAPFMFWFDSSAGVLKQRNVTDTAWVVVDLQNTTSGQSKNILINGAMAVDQRNAGAAQTFTAGAALAYCVDRWYGYSTGANVTGQRVAGSSPDQYLYQFTGAASVTGIGYGQRIEAINSQHLAGTTATISIKLSNSLLTAVGWALYYANTNDTFGTLASPTRTLISSGTFTVNSTLTTYSASVAIPAGATTGLELVLTVGAQTSGTWKIGAAQIEQGTTATSFERRSYGSELLLCQRYLPCWRSSGSSGVLGSGIIVGPGSAYFPIFFKVPARVPPTSWFASAASDFYVFNNAGTPAVSSFSWNAGATVDCAAISVSTVTTPFTSNQPAYLNFVNSNGVFYFTGCEL